MLLLGASYFLKLLHAIACEAYLWISCDLSNIIQIQILKDVILARERWTSRLRPIVFAIRDAFVVQLIFQFTCIARIQYCQVWETRIHFSGTLLFVIRFVLSHDQMRDHFKRVTATRARDRFWRRIITDPTLLIRTYKDVISPKNATRVAL